MTLPDLHGPVVAARRDPLSARVEGQTPDGGGVSLQGSLALPVVVLFLVNT